MKKAEALTYVIHKHAATRLHYDLRLEKDGVLKSWAVPKEPSPDAGVKRLAISVEDHQLSYGTFEGDIPEGNYGAGSVEIWDNGIYTPIKTETNEWVVELKGKRLKGTYCLIKLKPKVTGDKNWLFFKKKTK
ncbi:MAG: DNA polymerase ligase N-terminal domain-containing protein [Candidatus Omnitrophota bacterium]